MKLLVIWINERIEFYTDDGTIKQEAPCKSLGVDLDISLLSASLMIIYQKM